MKNLFFLLTFGCILLAADASENGTLCLQRPSENGGSGCGEETTTTYYYFDAEHNKCLPYDACTSDEEESDNLFEDSAACELECPATKCAEPDPISNGTYSLDENNVTFACDRGYTLIGEDTRYCQYNGTWSGKSPTCTPSDVTCPLEDEEHHSRHVVLRMCPEAQTPGCRVLYSCNKGYSKVFGHFGIVCLPNGTWSAEPPLCGRLAILHGEEEISENVEIKDGDSNVQISCTMEPTFPPMAPVMWYPHGNTSWSTDHSAYVLTFNQLHYRDAGDYTCSLAYSDSPLTRRIKIIVVPKSYVPIEQYMPPWVLKLPHKIDITCIFQGIPKPNVSWYFNHHQLNNSNERFVVTEHSQSSNIFAVSRLEIRNPTAADRGRYSCVARNEYDEVNATLDINDLAPSRFTGKKRSIATMASVDVPSFCTAQDTVVFVGKVGRKLSDNRYHVSVSEQLTFNVQLDRVITLQGFTNDPAMKRLPTIFIVRLTAGDEYALVSCNPFEEKLSQLVKLVCN